MKQTITIHFNDSIPMFDFSGKQAEKVHIKDVKDAIKQIKATMPEIKSLKLDLASVSCWGDEFTDGGQLDGTCFEVVSEAHGFVNDKDFPDCEDGAGIENKLNERLNGLNTIGLFLMVNDH